MMKRNYPVSALELSNTAAHSSHHSRSFMPIYAGRSEQVILDLLQVGVTDAAGLHANQDFPRADGWRRNLFNADHAATPVDRGVHGFRYDEPVRIGSRQ